MKLTFVDWFNIGVLVVTVLGLIWFVVTQLGTRARVRQRLQAIAEGNDDSAEAQGALSLQRRVLIILSLLGNRLPMFSTGQRHEMRGRLVSAGYRQPGALQVLMGASIATALVLCILFVWLGWDWLDKKGLGGFKVAGIALVGYVGLLLPRMVLDKLVARRQLAIANSFPDALDLMVVCANSGLGLNATIQRVAHEMEFLAPELSDEFNLTAGQLQVSGDPSQVLLDLADRTRMDTVRSLASTLNQSRQYGTPVSEALRILAAGERVARRMRTEEAAGKLATKMTLPMMIFILPTVLLIVGGPAVLSLMSSFSGMSN